MKIIKPKLERLNILAQRKEAFRYACSYFGTDYRYLVQMYSSTGTKYKRS